MAFSVCVVFTVSEPCTLKDSIKTVYPQMYLKMKY